MAETPEETRRSTEKLEELLRTEHDLWRMLLEEEMEQLELPFPEETGNGR